MKRPVMFLALIAFVSLLAQGCSGETRGSLKEAGNDMKRDVNDVARKADNKVQDALD